jgi:ATP-binding protein involved in chromosome partitioning
VKLNIIGLIENMSGYVCPKCGTSVNIFKEGGGQKLAKDLDVPFLGRIPIDPQICEDSDKGVAFIAGHIDSPAAKAFTDIVEKVETFVDKKQEQN